MGRDSSSTNTGSPPLPNIGFNSVKCAGLRTNYVLWVDRCCQCTYLLDHGYLYADGKDSDTVTVI